MNIEQRLVEIGVNVPSPVTPAANYVPFQLAGTQLFVSGQLPFDGDSKLPPPSKLGDTADVEAGAAAARLCAINLLAQLKVAVNGDWDRLVATVKLVGFVNATPDFTQHPLVVNGASDFMVEALGDRGRHARSAIGVGSLPFGMPVEVEAIFEIRP